jgi:hypothetical protein
VFLPIQRAIEFYLEAAPAPACVGISDGLQGAGCLTAFSNESAHVGLVSFNPEDGAILIGD